MKNTTLLVILISALSFFSCNTEKLILEENTIDPNIRVIEGTNNNLFSRSTTEAELVVDLIAGQNYIAGAVSVYASCDDVTIIYTTYSDWTIAATHMSFGDCNNQSIPTTHSGNPKIGKFDYSSTHSDGINEVSYIINREATGEDFCFAAHAVVYNINGEEETAWAEGLDEDGNPLTFSGNSWATFAQASLNDCEAGLIHEIE